MTNPAVSVCVPTYQGEAYLRECLESVLAQSLRDLEVVIVDDDSNDDTFEIASEYARRDERFHVHRNPVRLGLVGNWNRALELSRGTWIKLLFQDDLVAPECFERLVDVCRERGRMFAFCRRHLLFDESVAEETRQSYLGHEAVLDEVYQAREELSPEQFSEAYVKHPGWNLVGEPTAALFHRSVLERFGTFDPGLVQLCDAEYWTRLGSNVGVIQIPERLATFRVHRSSTTAHNISQRTFRMQTVDPLILNYLILRRPYYANLREVLYRKRGKRRTWLDFADGVYRAWKSASPRLSRPGSDQAQHEAEWKSVVAVYPELKRIGYLGLFLAAISAVIRRLGLGRSLEVTNEGGE